MEKNYSWSFPKLDGGSSEGLNDAGVETFKNDVFESLAKEIIQNSVDARLDKTKPVKIKFEHIEFKTKSFPNYKQYRTILKDCLEAWKDNQKTKTFFERALNSTNTGLINILKISDFNTTGLTGSKDLKNMNSNWVGLVKSTGNSNKTMGDGGAFGIGKNAPFACSSIRTVFYSTLDKCGIKAFQGVTRLVSRTSNNQEYRGTGFYGDANNDNAPIYDEEIKNLDFYNRSLFSRSQTGTDVFIYDVLLEESWTSKIIQSALRNFFVAIFNGSLIVEVGKTTIKRDNLLQVIKEQSDDEKYLPYLYYLAMTEGEKFPKAGYEYTSDYDGLELYLLEGKDYPKQIAMFRKIGMRIFDRKNFRGATNFIGVFYTTGTDVNQKLSEMEPAAHDKWEHQRSQDYLGRENFNSKKYLNGIYDWTKKCVRSLVELSEDEVLDFEGAGQYLPIDREIDDLNLKGKKKDVFPKLPNKDILLQNEGLEKVALKDFSNEPTNQKLGEKKSRKKKGRNEVNDKGNKNYENEKDELGGELLSLDSFNNVIDAKVNRIISINKKRYKLSIQSNVQEKGIIELSVSDETNRILKYNILKARDSYGNSFKVSKNKIGPVKFKKGKSINIEVEFKEEILAAFVAIIRGEKK
ncbi:hypothetical protein AB6M11_002229 [Listeria monocytogenes]|uniref:hypothetical protein n=1 Tax=Listeria monocytogenes TaxID=1639 RepID=UPI0010EC9F80|nr:hypothetical protein [Listeria monocytogenes]EAE2397046.1 hypothetical protein [Listeria monocytogenes]EIA3595385.1 hypothetical protein [Listeria monocytogenes]EII0396245.1 hypothetical protein [Listeria monocytogenes]EIO8245135.1 hypothetical protein [Listeria monocytogenes]EIS4451882.1 hypothetical protein [Listeria monocytogenes]